MASSATGELMLSSEKIPSKAFQQNIEDDTDFRQQEDKGFDPNYITTNYYLSAPHLPQTEQIVGANWRDKILTSAFVEQHESNGLFISNRKNIFCFGLKKNSL